MSKKLIIFLIVFLSVLAISLLGGLIFAINFNTKFVIFNDDSFYSNYSNKLVEAKEISNIKDLDININVADVKIEEHDLDNIKVKIYSNDPKNYEIIEESNKIKVKFEEKKKVFSFFNKSGVVKIFVPTGYNKNIKINSIVGDIKIKEIKDASLEVKSDVGDVKVNKINKAIINSRVGDIKIKEVNELVSDVVTGDTKITNVNIINSKTKTGDIKIETVNTSLNLESKTGDIKIVNANLKENSKITSGVGDVKIMNTTNCYIEGKTNVGDTKINNNDRMSDIVLIVSSKVGDIKINY